MKEKVIELGIDKGYLPKKGAPLNEWIKAWYIQYARLAEENGEAYAELRKGNKQGFENEYGDVQVTQTNCLYIQRSMSHNQIINKTHLRNCIMRYFDEELLNMAYHKFGVNYGHKEHALKCLELAYNKVSKRQGVMINGDYFKPGDLEYQEFMREKVIRNQ